MKFDAKCETNKIIKFIQKYFKENKIDGIVMGISGGKDSTIASALFAKAIGSENVIGITMPCNSIKQDIDDANKVADFLGFKLYSLDLGEIFHNLSSQINEMIDVEIVKINEAAINLKPRLRMSTLYYVAQALSVKNNKRYIVAGTGNKCELYVGYFTKFGDGASDINILGDLTVNEVKAIGDYLKLPQYFVHKTPSDGLSGKSDEEKLGVSYEDIEKVINNEIINEKIEKMHKANRHKLRPITIYKKINVYEETKEIVQTLIRRKETVATMESCTSGLLASTITNVHDASKVFKYGANTYSNEAKIKMGVDAKIIDEHGVYSIPVAKEMAMNAASFAKADYGVGITGKIETKDQEKIVISEIFVSIYIKNKNKFYDEIIKIKEEDKKLGKEKIIEKVIHVLRGAIDENKKDKDIRQ